MLPTAPPVVRTSDPAYAGRCLLHPRLGLESDLVSAGPSSTGSPAGRAEVVHAPGFRSKVSSTTPEPNHSRATLRAFLEWRAQWEAVPMNMAAAVRHGGSRSVSSQETVLIYSAPVNLSKPVGVTQISRHDHPARPDPRRAPAAHRTGEEQRAFPGRLSRLLASRGRDALPYLFDRRQRCGTESSPGPGVAGAVPRR
jgi:hypothetical protein